MTKKQDETTSFSYGTSTTLRGVCLSIWDGSGKTKSFRKGVVFKITYHEQDGSLGLTDKNGVEYCVDVEERKDFNEEWDTIPI